MKREYESKTIGQQLQQHAPSVYPKAGKNPPGTDVEAKRQTQRTQKCSAGVFSTISPTSPEGFLLGAKHTSLGAWGAVWLQRKHRLNAVFPDMLLLAPARGQVPQDPAGQQAAPHHAQPPTPAPCSACAQRGQTGVSPVHPSHPVQAMLSSICRGPTAPQVWDYMGFLF